MLLTNSQSIYLFMLHAGNVSIISNFGYVAVILSLLIGVFEWASLINFWFLYLIKL